MSDENKSCPFCGKGVYEGHEDGCYFALSDLEVTGKRLVMAWNNRTENAAQAQEIDELKACVERLRDAAKLFASSDPSVHKDCVIVFERDLDNLDAVIAETPAQSLSAHDAAIEEGVVKSSILLCEAEKVGANKFDDRADIAWDDAVTSCMNAIRNAQRKHNVR